MILAGVLIAVNLSILAFIFWWVIREQNPPAEIHTQETADVEMQPLAIEPEQIDKNKIKNPPLKHGPVFTRIGGRCLNYFAVNRFCVEHGYHYPSTRHRRR